MASMLIWGKAREILSGDLPPGVSSREVETFAELQAQLDGSLATLILVDPRHLPTAWQSLEELLQGGASPRALLVVVAEASEADAVLQRFPFVHDVLIKPVTPARLKLRLDRALDALNGRQVIQQLDGALARKSLELHEVNKIGVALSAERDIDTLFSTILAKSREITTADAGSLYLVKNGKEGEAAELQFELAQNDSVAFDMRKQAMPLDETSIAGYAALSGNSVTVADAYNLPPESPYKVSRSFDQRFGYRTKSMLAVPMKDHENKVIGVVQLINKKRNATTVLQPAGVVDEMVIPFTQVDAELVNSLASQAAVALENNILIGNIKKLFEAFVKASVTAVESRDPTTSGHSGRVAELTVAIAQKVDALESGPFRGIRFSNDQLQEIKYASLLHDFGKVGVREKVLIKGKKLYVGELLLIRQRFGYIRRTLEAEHLREKLDKVMAGADPGLLARLDRDYEDRRLEAEQYLRMIIQANEPTILEEESFQALMDLPNRTFTDVEGNRQPFLTPNEVSALSIRRGSLSEKERKEIESHVSHTFRFLSEIPWTGEYRRVPEIAYAHHEKLDGTGYPRRLSAAEIPIQSKMMTISDIFDALVAWDRPYKKSVPVEKALAILNEEASQGKLDKDLLRLFIEAKIYEQTLPRTGATAELTR